jgi:rfaE bifunctional protein nucleotidyltransferase chain/domain
MLNGKIKTVSELQSMVRGLKSERKKIVLCHGVFDLLHIGHIRHFEQARRMGDALVVTVTPDEHVNKGPHRPAFPQELRVEAIAALKWVDYVAVNEWPAAVETIRLLRPDIYVKGPDYKTAAQDITGTIIAEAEAVRSIGGEIRFTDDITFSSSNLLNRHLPLFPPAVVEYLDQFRRRHSVDEVLDWLARAADLRPVVVGEAIIDEYVFCDAIGKSTKDPVLATLQKRVETYAGGSLAVANHLAGLCRRVTLVTQLGDQERREHCVRGKLRSNVDPVLLTKSNAPTIHKSRIVDQYSGNKLVEIYRMEDRPTDGDDARSLVEALEQSFDGRDLTIVADYGHGMLTPPSIDRLCERAPFLAVNVQSNAGNRGFNPISKYRRADYVCLAMHELEIETRRRNADAREGQLEIAKRIDCPRFTVTLGKAGSLHYSRADGFTEAPALATRVLDRVGAGDAVLAVTSLLARLGAPWDVVGFIGNAAGAELISELGNRVPLDRIGLSKHITALLK